MRKLKNGDIRPYRGAQLRRQEGICLLCKKPIEEDPVLDHCHKSGECRGVLHRGCNALLGKIENAMLICKVDIELLPVYLSNVTDYILNSRCGVLHPKHKTEDEKRLRKNKLARKRRVLKKTSLTPQEENNVQH